MGANMLRNGSKNAPKSKVDLLPDHIIKNVKKRRKRLYNEIKGGNIKD